MAGPRLASLALAAALAAAPPAAGQETGTPAPVQLPGPVAESGAATIEVPSPVVTVDQERLFTDSAWGRRVQTEVETRSRVLSAENRQIEEELIAEEQALTDLRQEMEPEAFRERAEAFDAKVQRLRAEQDAKTRELTAFREAERQRFFSEVLEVLTDVVTERGAVVILDQRAIVLSVAAIDITDAAIARIDATMGDGRQP